jgi:hypothetical protein
MVNDAAEPGALRASCSDIAANRCAPRVHAARSVPRLPADRRRDEFERVINLTLMLFVFGPGTANTAQQIAFAPDSAEHVEDVTPGS